MSAPERAASSQNVSHQGLWKEEVLPRLSYTIALPLFLICEPIALAWAAVTGAAALVTPWKRKEITQHAIKCLSEASSCAIGGVYTLFLNILNPKAKHVDDPKKVLPTGLLTEPLENLALTCSKSNDFWKRHVASRLIYAVLPLSCLVTRVWNGVIGALAIVPSILTFGTCKSLNCWTEEGLKAPAIISDIFFCTVRFLDPQVKDPFVEKLRKAEATT